MPEEAKKTCIRELPSGKCVCEASGLSDCPLVQACQLELQAYKAGLRNDLYYSAKDIAANHNNVKKPDYAQKYDCTGCSLFYDYNKQHNQR